jgi:hypothetical protein
MGISLFLGIVSAVAIGVSLGRSGIIWSIIITIIILSLALLTATGIISILISYPWILFTLSLGVFIYFAIQQYKKAQQPTIKKLWEKVDKLGDKIEAHNREEYYSIPIEYHKILKEIGARLSIYDKPKLIRIYKKYQETIEGKGIPDSKHL